MPRFLSRAFAALALCAALPAFAGKTLDAIRQKGQIVIGVSTGVAGFSSSDSQGRWTGLDVDVGKAVAAAILGDPEKVRWVPLTPQQRFTALQSGEVDLLSRNTTFTLTRDASLGLYQTVTSFFDGQAILVPAKCCADPVLCVQGGRTDPVPPCCARWKN
jgi:general L-amino acid transport system substrate-binding protein